MELLPDHYARKVYEWPVLGSDRKIQVRATIQHKGRVQDSTRSVSIELTLVDPKVQQDEWLPMHELGETPAFLDYLCKERLTASVSYVISGVQGLQVFLKDDCIQVGPDVKALFVDPKRGQVWTDMYRVKIEANQNFGSSNYMSLHYDTAMNLMMEMSSKVPNEELRVFQAKKVQQRAGNLTTAPLEMFMECAVGEDCRACYFRPAVLRCSGLGAQTITEMMDAVSEVAVFNKDVKTVD